MSERYIQVLCHYTYFPLKERTYIRNRLANQRIREQKRPECVYWIRVWHFDLEVTHCWRNEFSACHWCMCGGCVCVCCRRAFCTLAFLVHTYGLLSFSQKRKTFEQVQYAGTEPKSQKKASAALVKAFRPVKILGPQHG